MSLEANKKLVSHYYEAINSGNLAALDQVVAAGYQHHTPNLPAGLSPFKAMLSMYRQGFPDMCNTIETLIAEGDLVVAHATTSGTHTGSFLGHPATGKPFTATGIDIFRVADSLLVERWGAFDTIAMLQQLGLYSPVQS
jgi:steroid delta-isomerase-like uncharacterized protein